MDFPLPVAVGVLIKKNHLLLLKRNKEPYQGLWSLPAGKVELNEHLSHTIEREFLEETGIKTCVSDYLSIVSEHLFTEGQLRFHILLHLFQLESEESMYIESEEGELKWFDLSTFKQLDGKMIPSDFLMVEKRVKKKDKNYYNCVIENTNGKHLLKKFT